MEHVNNNETVSTEELIESTELTPEETKALNEVTDARDLYATFFHLYGIRYKQGLKKLSKRQLIRLNESLIEYPLNTKEYRHIDKIEKELVVIGDKLLQAKYAMMLQTMYEKAAKEQSSEVENQSVKEETNE